MTKDTVIGVGVGLLIGWLLWRRRGLAGLLGVGVGTGPGSCGGCGGCGGGSGAPGSCVRASSAGIGNYSQGAGFTLQGAP